MLTHFAADISQLVRVTACLIGFKNLVNLVLGFGLLFLLVLLVQELGGSRHGRQ